MIMQGECIYGDLEGYRASDNFQSTIPPKLFITAPRPYIVIIHTIYGTDSSF